MVGAFQFSCCDVDNGWEIEFWTQTRERLHVGVLPNESVGDRPQQGIPKCSIMPSMMVDVEIMFVLDG